MNDLDRDPLTQAGNLESLQARFAELSGDRARFGMILFDIDGFIYFNDRYGHEEGDRKLQQIAVLIRQNVPTNTDVYRSGGEEFVVFLNNFKMAEVLLAAMKICQVINQHFSDIPPFKRSITMPDRSFMEVQFSFTVSSGVVFYPEHGINYDSLYRSAHEAAFKASKNLYGGVVGVAKFYNSCLIP